MKTVGIICEYNPFHNGHKYHIEQAKKLTGADTAVCVMSGNFVQRGEPAIYDKFLRAKAAIVGGGDLVVELPAVYALSCAEKFAAGAVEILDKMGVDFLCFGAECGSIEKLDTLAQVLSEETDEFKMRLKELVKSGESYQKARDKAISDVYSVSPAPLKQPNNALATEYLKAVKRLGSNIIPVAVKRIGAGYNDENLKENSFSSASAIRKNFGRDALKSNVPEDVFEIFENAEPTVADDISQIALYRLRTMQSEALERINDVSEGIENRIIACAKKCSSFSELVEAVSSKRYTKSRVARIIMCAVLGIEKSDVTECGYIRVLALNENGAKFLKKIKKTCPLPIVTKVSAKNADMLKTDIAASDIYSILKKDKTASCDFTVSPAVVGKEETHYVYILRCCDNTLYTGWTNDLKKRVADHNAKKGAKYTKARTPVAPVYFEVYKNKSEALAREYEIKQLTREKKEELIKNFDNSKLKLIEW